MLDEVDSKASGRQEQVQEENSGALTTATFLCGA
jgi:hypothetical protein